MTKNRTHTTRLARRIQASTGLSYQQALTVARRTLIKPATISVWHAETEHGTPVAGPHTDREHADTAAKTASARLVRVDLDIDGNLTSTSVEHDYTRARDVVWADEDGEFTLTGGGHGNPGCDDCGMFDAVARVDGTYLCAAAAAELGLIRPIQDADSEELLFCYECGEQVIADPEGSLGVYVHARDLDDVDGYDLDADHVALVDEPELFAIAGLFCRNCHKPAGADYHVAGVVDPGENNIFCGECWDPRLA